LWTSASLAHREEGHLAEFPRPAMASRCRADLATTRARMGDEVAATLFFYIMDALLLIKNNYTRPLHS
jgi:hypothetical protein